jgi:hypothetical protein
VQHRSADQPAAGDRIPRTERWTGAAEYIDWNARAGRTPLQPHPGPMYRITRGIQLQQTPIFGNRMLHLPDGTPVALHEYDERLAEYEAAHAARAEAPSPSDQPIPG